MAPADNVHYSVRWALYHFRPNTRQHTELQPRPLRHEFDDATSARVRVVMFGDLHVDEAPTCSPEIARVFADAELIVGNHPAGTVDPARMRTTFANLEIDASRCALSVANSGAGAETAATVHRLRSLGVTPLGAIAGGASPLSVLRAGDLHVGVAAWTHWLDDDVFAEGEGVATPEQVLHRDWAQVKQAQQLDTLLATPHWEWSRQFVPRQDTVAIAQHLAESGFDVIGGHHPGVVQPMEWFAGPNARNGICQFSLGGLGNAAEAWAQRLGVVLEAELIAEGARRGELAAYTLHPVATIDTTTGPRIVPVRYAPWNLRQHMWQRIALLFDEARYPNKAPPLQAASSF